MHSVDFFMGNLTRFQDHSSVRNFDMESYIIFLVHVHLKSSFGHSPDLTYVVMLVCIEGDNEDAFCLGKTSKKMGSFC